MYRGIRLKKKLGQHLLLNDEVRHRIVDYANISDKNIVLEIGAGTGDLTSTIKERARKVIAIEKDKDLVNILKERFSNESNVEIIEGDVLKIDLPHYDKSVSTPPYNISSKLIFLLLNRECERIIITLQKEFAERLIARPGSRNYGRLTVMTECKAKVKLLEYISKSNFYPQPKVDSAIVSIFPRKDVNNFVKNELFNEFVRILFSQRRKRVRKVIFHYLKSKFGDDANRIFLSLKLADKRVYELSKSDFKNLFQETINRVNIIEKKP